MFLWLLVLTALLFLATFRFRRRKMYKLASLLPAPHNELPLIGIAYAFSGNTEDIMNQIKTYIYESMKNDGLIRAWCGPLLFFGSVFQKEKGTLLGSLRCPSFCQDSYHLEGGINQVKNYDIVRSLISWSCKNIELLSQRNQKIQPVMPLSKMVSVMVNPVDLEFIMKNCLDKSDFHRFSRAIIGNGIIFAPVSIWRRRRKVIVRLFSPKIVDTFVEVFSKQSQKLANRLSSYANTGEVSMWPFLSAYTLDSVCETTMGVKINAQDNPNTPFLVAMEILLNLVCERFFHLWLQPDWMYKFFPQYKQHQHYLKEMYDFTDEVIKKKKEKIKTDKNNRPESVNEDGNYQYRTFLEHLIINSGGEKGYTNVELREEVLTLATAGTDTSAVAIGFTMKLLAKYPHIQEMVYEEIYEIYGDSDQLLVKDDLPKLKYLDRVVKESLRLFPPVPMIIRNVAEDTKLPSGRILPAGGIVAIAIWGLHRDPKHWGPTAEEFDPDRFLPERFNLVHACNFMPFSQGPRNCVGYQYAMMSIKIALSAVIRRYKLVGEPEKSAIPHIRVKLGTMLKDVDGYKVSLERRKPVTSQ